MVHLENNPYLKKAVALKYDQGRDHAPRVVASGRGVVAEQILAVAHEHNIPMHENTGLVEALIDLDLDTAIPLELYKAVAEVLSYVYRLDKQKRNG